MAGRLTLLLTSPRVAAGLLTRAAWSALGEAAHVLGYADEPQLLAVSESGIAVREWGESDGEPDTAPDTAPGSERDSEHDSTAGTTARLGRELVDLAQGARDGYAASLVVWVGSADGDPGLTDVVAAEVTRRTDPPEVEVLLGSHDVPGARLLDLVAVMDRLRSPGGCPWDAEQTHTSLVKYLVEEAYEAAEAIDSGDRRHTVEELGDVLLQVAFHARIGEEDPDDPFDIDDVAEAIVTKLVRRHPHVFANSAAGSASDVEASWETIKSAERAERAAQSPDGEAESADLLHGIPAALPPLERATKIVRRLRRAGRADLLPGWTDHNASDPGVTLLELLVYLDAADVDAEASLRADLQRLTARLGERVGPPYDQG